jgi:hypothetical protein
MKDYSCISSVGSSQGVVCCLHGSTEVQSLLVPNVVRYTVRLYEVLPCKQHLEYPPFLFPILMWFFMAITRTRTLATHRRGFLEHEEQNELFKLPKILFYFVQSQDNSFSQSKVL